jgi:hypothetical protein
MRWSVRLLAVALGLLPLVGLAEPPSLVFEAPVRFAPLASRLQQLNPHAVRGVFHRGQVLYLVATLVCQPVDRSVVQAQYVCHLSQPYP